MLKFLVPFIALSLVLANESIGGEDIIVIKAKGAYCIINKGKEQGVNNGQFLYVEKRTGEGTFAIGKVKVIRTTANRAVVERQLTGANLILKEGDKLYLQISEADSNHTDIDKTQNHSSTPNSNRVDKPTKSFSQLSRLKPGMWIEIKGPASPEKGLAKAEEIEEVEFSSSLSTQKIEVTAPAGSVLPTQGHKLQVLDHWVIVSEETRFENAAHEEVPRFQVDKGGWLKVKVRIKDNDALFARVIRQIKPRQRFKVVGQVREVAVDENRVTVGPMQIAIHPQHDLDLLKSDKSHSPLNSFLLDEQKSVLFNIQPGENVLLGGQLTSQGRTDDERDLRREKKKDKQVLFGELKMVLLWRMNRSGSFAFLEGNLAIREQLRNQQHEARTYPHKLSQAYIYWAISESFSLQVGRQDFDEEREWVYDERLDGIRLRALKGPLELEISASMGRELLEQDNDTGGILNIIGLLRYYLNPDHFLSAYVVHRTDRNQNGFSPKVFGLRSYSRPRRGLHHWLELALARGEAGPKRIGGYAVDGGVSNIFYNLPGRPTFTAGVAYAKGDTDRDDQRGAFRQTGLQDNNARFGGVTSFRYYGEVMDPELSNIVITTLGVGFRPKKNFSIDWVFHTYHQDGASTDLGNTRLRADPTGESRALGWGVDMIMGYRIPKWANIELVLGRFEPGRAFSVQDPAHLAEFKVRMKF